MKQSFIIIIFLLVNYDSNAYALWVCVFNDLQVSENLALPRLSPLWWWAKHKCSG